MNLAERFEAGGANVAHHLLVIHVEDWSVNGIAIGFNNDTPADNLITPTRYCGRIDAPRLHCGQLDEPLPRPWF